MKDDEQYMSERYDGGQDNYNTLMLRLDPSPTLDEIKRFLLRKTKLNVKTETWERVGDLKPMFKEEGIEELMLELRSRMSIDKVLSKLESNQINLIIRELGEIVMEFIYFNHDTYEIKESDYNKILYCVKHNVFIFLRRALGGTENELITKAFLYREVVSKSRNVREDNEEKPRGTFSFLGGGRT